MWLQRARMCAWGVTATVGLCHCTRQTLVASYLKWGVVKCSEGAGPPSVLLCRDIWVNAPVYKLLLPEAFWPAALFPPFSIARQTSGEHPTKACRTPQLASGQLTHSWEGLNKYTNVITSGSQKGEEEVWENSGHLGPCVDWGWLHKERLTWVGVRSKAQRPLGEIPHPAPSAGPSCV